MVMHARSGGNLEVMGLVQGKVDANTLVVVDSFALPVEGTETRVNAQAQAYEYMTTYTDSSEAVGRLHKVNFVAGVFIVLQKEETNGIFNRFCDKIFSCDL